jgi:hypothetical protein
VGTVNLEIIGALNGCYIQRPKNALSCGLQNLLLNIFYKIVKIQKKIGSVIAKRRD